MHPSICECSKYGYANMYLGEKYPVFKRGSHITNWISLGCRIEKEMQLGSTAECGTKMNPRVQKLWHLISINTSQCESLAAACKRVSSLFLFMHVACCIEEVAAVAAVDVAATAVASCKCSAADATVSGTAFTLLWNGFCHLFIAFRR